MSLAQKVMGVAQWVMSLAQWVMSVAQWVMGECSSMVDGCSSLISTTERCVRGVILRLKLRHPGKKYCSLTKYFIKLPKKCVFFFQFDIPHQEREGLNHYI